MQFSTMLALALASFTAVSAVPSPVNGPASNNVQQEGHEFIKRAADNVTVAGAADSAAVGKLCNIAHGDDDCHGASGDKVNSHCACLYYIAASFPHTGTWVFTCQPPGTRQC